MAPICRSPSLSAVGEAWALRCVAVALAMQISRSILPIARISLAPSGGLLKNLFILVSLNLRFLLRRLVDVVIDTDGVLNTVACCGDGDGIVVIVVTAAATRHGSDRSQRHQEQGRVGEDPREFSGRATGVTQTQERKQEETEGDGRYPAGPAFRRVRRGEFLGCDGEGDVHRAGYLADGVWRERVGGQYRSGWAC